MYGCVIGAALLLDELSAAVNTRILPPFLTESKRPESKCSTVISLTLPSAKSLSFISPLRSWSVVKEIKPVFGKLRGDKETYPFFRTLFPRSHAPRRPSLGVRLSARRADLSHSPQLPCDAPLQMDFRAGRSPDGSRDPSTFSEFDMQHDRAVDPVALGGVTWSPLS